MGKLACDVVLIALAVSVLLDLLAVFLPWGSVTSINFGVSHAKYYLWYIIVEPKIELMQKLQSNGIFSGKQITCPWETNTQYCYKISTLDAFTDATSWQAFENFASLNGPTAGATNMGAAFYGGALTLLMLIGTMVLLVMSGCYLFQYCYSLKPENRGKKKWRRLAQILLSFAIVSNFFLLVTWQVTLFIMNRDVGLLVFSKGDPTPAHGWILSLFNLFVLLGVLLSYRTWRSPSAEAAQVAEKLKKRHNFDQYVGNRGRRDSDEKSFLSDTSTDASSNASSVRRGKNTKHQSRLDPAVPSSPPQGFFQSFYGSNATGRQPAAYNDHHPPPLVHKPGFMRAYPTAGGKNGGTPLMPRSLLGNGSRMLPLPCAAPPPRGRNMQRGYQNWRNTYEQRRRFSSSSTPRSSSESSVCSPSRSPTANRRWSRTTFSSPFCSSNSENRRYRSNNMEPWKPYFNGNNNPSNGQRGNVLHNKPPGQMTHNTDPRHSFGAATTQLGSTTFDSSRSSNTWSREPPMSVASSMHPH
ncbi:unnamed protein product [Amoebophrya sp. A120]|nr:unnamed protein product [Amoebophrya sp. A120]|eukprot:GSA120T00005494001.1